jgi:septal ring factor EnvC (AmiA/AmiB activator)
MPMWLSSRLIALLCSVCTALPLLASEKADLEQLQKQINQISGKLGSERKDRDELQELLSRTEKHISQFSASLRDLQQQQAVLDSRLNSLQQQQDSQQQGLVRQRHELHHLLVSA